MNGNTETLNSQNNLEKENGARVIMLPDFRLYYKVMVNQNNMVLAHTHIDQWKRIESPEINTHT